MSWEEIGVSGGRGRLGWRRWLWGKYRRSAAAEGREKEGKRVSDGQIERRLDLSGSRA